ncbi:carbohydrate kinase [Curtobacterium sp. 'Ferrero']|nr:carbohydrate kinase [Curtobacterium sp. 'Ferrero']
MTVAGEALVDVVHGDSGRGDDVREVPGGSPANVALGLARLGCDVEFATRFADDERGRRIAEHLRASGVRIAPGSAGAGRTSTATVRLGPGGQPRYEFDITWDLPGLDETPAWLHVGSIAAFLEPGADSVLDAARQTSAAGGSVSFDPNVRPALLGPRAEVLARVEELSALASVAKLSDEDAAWLWPELGDADAVLDRVLALGAGLAVVTAGSAGSVLASPTHRVHVPAAHTSVVDTVGAGDTYTAALVWQLTRQPDTSADATADTQQDERTRLGGLDSPTLLGLGRTCSRAAAVTVARRGADLPTADDLVPVRGS